MFLGDGDKMICLVCEELWGIKAQIKALHAGLFFFSSSFLCLILLRYDDNRPRTVCPEIIHQASFTLSRAL